MTPSVRSPKTFSDENQDLSMPVWCKRPTRYLGATSAFLKPKSEEILRSRSGANDADSASGQDIERCNRYLGMWHLRNLPQHANALLPTGEEYVAGFVANADLHIFPNAIPRVVVVSTHNVHLFVAGKFLSWRPKRLIASISLGEALDVTRGKLGFKLELGGEKLTIPFFHTDALNKAIAASQRTPVATSPQTTVR